MNQTDRPFFRSPIAWCVAGLWAFHAAAASYPGRAYLHFAQLNDSSQPVTFNMLLHPSLVCAAAIVLLRGGLSRPASASSKCGAALALACWATAATLSSIVNANVDQVIVTYCSVFLCGAAVYVALAGATLTMRDLEWAIAGLAIGSLFPLVAGLAAFFREWGLADTVTVLSAYRNLVRMELYEAATFGNRGNTAAFIVLVTPVFIWVTLDHLRSAALRVLCGAVLVVIVCNLLVLQVRAAFIALALSTAAVFAFRTGLKRYPVFLASAGLAAFALASWAPDATLMMSDRLRPVLMVDADDDTSVMERTESMKEGMQVAEHHWVLGVGPGGAQTFHSNSSAHQFEVQQFLEVGIIGLIASSLLTISLFVMLAKTLWHRSEGGPHDVRFALIVGPTSFVLYSVLANAALNVGYVNTWTILSASMLALAPGFGARSDVLSAVRETPQPALLREEA